MNSVQSATFIQPFLIWNQLESNPSFVTYHMGNPLSAPLGDFATTADFSNGNYMIVSNATLKWSLLLHNNKNISCYTPSNVAYLTANIKVAGKPVYYSLIVFRCMYNVLIIIIKKERKTLLLSSEPQCYPQLNNQLCWH